MTEPLEPGGIARRTVLRLALPAAGGLLLAARATSVRAADGATVNIDNFAFTPATITVPKGSTVTWVNRDDIPHLVVCPSVNVRSKVLDTDQSFAVTFEKPGRAAYFCGLHPHMTGTVVVTG
jgi:plastocyanin